VANTEQRHNIDIDSAIHDVYNLSVCIGNHNSKSLNFRLYTA